MLCTYPSSINIIQQIQCTNKLNSNIKLWQFSSLYCWKEGISPIFKTVLQEPKRLRNEKSAKINASNIPCKFLLLWSGDFAVER